MSVFEEFLFNLASGIMVSAGLVGAVAVPALAQSAEAETHQSTLTLVYLTQATSSEALTELDEQPSAPADLEIDHLTDEQIADIAAIFDAYAPQIEAAIADYLAALTVMNDLLVPTTADLALVEAHNNVVATEQAVDNLVFQRNLAIRAV